MSSDVEWWEPGTHHTEEITYKDVYTGEIPDLAEARGLTVGPDELLVVVFPQWVDQRTLRAHSDRLREVLGNRFILVMGDDIQLAKVSKDQWAVGTHDH